MNFNLILVFLGVIAVNIVSGVLWNVRPLVKVRLRPPRHQIPMSMSPSTIHNNYHRAQSFPQRPRMPHHNFPMFSYRPNSYGPSHMNHGQHIPHSSNQHNYFRGPPHHFHQDEMLSDQHKLVKLETPNSNLVENSGFTLSSLDDGQHGYLSPKYKGWKPISKPHFQVPNRETKGIRHNYHTTEAYKDTNGKHHKMMLTTLFRDNVKSIKPPGHIKLKPEYSENRGVAIPLPPELGGTSITLPNSIFMDRPQNNYKFHSPPVTTSQSEDKPTIIRKPFPKFHQKLKANEKTNTSANPTSSKEVGENQLPQLVSKFKSFRPKMKPPVLPTHYDNEPEIDGIGPTNLPKIISPFPTKAPEVSTQPPMNLKEKFKKVRTRIRTGGPRLQGQAQVNTEDLRQVFSQQPPDSSETLINPKEAYGDVQRQQQHNSKPHIPITYSKNQNPVSFPTEEGGSQHVDKPRGEFSQNKRRPPNHESQRPEFTENNISDGGNANANAAGPGEGAKPPRERERKRRPTDHGKQNEPPAPFVYNDSPVYSEEFYLPPGFLQNPSLSGHNPVSFMTMPNSQPQVIHHTDHSGHPSQSPHQLYPINVVGSGDYHKSKHNHGTSPNSNYAEHNRPQFAFMNIQNGHQHPTGQGSQEGPGFTPEAFDMGVTPSPHSSQPTPFPYYHRGTQDHRFHHTPSPTPQYAYPSDSMYRPHYVDHSNRPFNEDSNSQRSKRIHQVVEYTRTTPSYYDRPSHNIQNQDPYSSGEYKQIPMEFMNHLRPILLDEVQGNSNAVIPLQIQTAPSVQNDFYSSEMYPAKEYFDNFFKSYDSPYKPAETTGGYVAESSGDEGFPVRTPLDSYKSSSNPQVQILRPDSKSINQTLANSSPKWSHPKDPIVSVSPIQEYTFESTVSPIQDIELHHRKPQTQKTWSKIKESHGSGLSSTENYLSVTGKQKRLSAQENKATTGIIHISTPKPVFLPSFSSTEDISSSEGIDQLKATSSAPVTESSISTSANSSSPRNFRTRGTPGIDKGSKTTESMPAVQSTTPQQGTRPLRRRKVGMQGNRIFSPLRVKERVNVNGGDEKLTEPPVTTHRPRRLILNTSTGATISERSDDSSAESIEARDKRLKARRRFFNRRMNVHANRAGMIGLRATTPSAADSTYDPVTYGESQWFRIKDDPEIAQPIELRASENNSMEKSSPPSIEDRTFSSRILPTTPNAKLEPLEMSSESLIGLENSSGRNFYGAENGDSSVAMEKNPEKSDSTVSTQTEPMSRSL